MGGWAYREGRRANVWRMKGPLGRAVFAPGQGVSLPHRQVWPVRLGIDAHGLVTPCSHLSSKGCLMSKCFAEPLRDRGAAWE